MSSETSTERHESLQTWQLFTLAGLIGATVVVFLSRGQSPAAIILLSCAVFAAAYIGVSALRTVLPLVGAERKDAPEMWRHYVKLIEETAERTWAAVERARAEEATEARLRAPYRASSRRAGARRPSRTRRAAHRQDRPPRARLRANPHQSP